MDQILSIISKFVSIVLTVAVLYSIYQIAVVVYNLYFHPLAKFPGPASRTGVHLGDYWHFLNGTHHQSLKELHDKYGDVVRIRPDALTFSTAGAWKDIYGSRPGKGQIPKDPRFYGVGGEGGTDIIFSNDEDHSRIRKLISHAFSDAALRQQEVILTKYFDLLVQGLKAKIDGPDAGNVDLTKWYNFLTFDVIGDMCFGESFGALESGEYHIWMGNLFQGIKFARFLSAATFYEPLLTILRALIKVIPSIAKAKREHQEFCLKKTAKRLDLKTDRTDFMSYILRHNDERGMTRAEIENTSGLLIIAGSETTSTLLTGATYLLLSNPDAYAKLKEEVHGAFKTAEEITLTSTSRLPFLHACLEEALRLYPPVPNALPRRLGADPAIIDGNFVPGNTSIAVSQWAAYHSDKNFYQPEAFVPERWLSNPPVQYRNDKREAFNPFSTGPRNCIGKNLAYNEMRSVMARMVWHFDMELCNKNETWMDQKVYFMWEKLALNVRLSHRRID
ncbi:cytochrome P450 monooxygenase-like protein [Bisporella sp. PMI_857]|nr:cytochrome P450 monooxygenase-like protein [Bisporella sp. PMI_857]